MTNTVWKWIQADRTRTPYEASKYFNLPIYEIWQLIDEAKGEEHDTSRITCQSNNQKQDISVKS